MNKLKLEYEMKMKGITAAEMCNALQISRSAFYRKCNGKTVPDSGSDDKEGY